MSNLGNVRSLTHTVQSLVCKSGKRIVKGKILRQFVSQNGYYKGVHLSKNNIIKTFMVHKLVAIAFCNKSEHNDCIDHIDGNSHNNSACNLRWCSYKQNSNNPITKIRMSVAKQGLCGVAHNHHKKVAQIDLKGNVIRVWDYVKQAENETGINRTSISLCANGKLNTAGGYKWTYNFKIEKR